MPIPAVFLSVAICIEVLGSLSYLANWHPRLAALALAGFTLLATSLFHTDFSAQSELHLFAKDIALAGTLICLAIQPTRPLK
jgi:putative oxidoreductase